MAGLLSYGAGAAGGLEAVLERKLREQAAAQSASQFQQKLAEEVRSNQANEGYRREALGENTKMREVQQASLDEDRKTRQNAALRDDIRARVGLRPIGSTVAPNEYDEEVKVGRMPLALYNPTTEMQGDDASQPVPVIKFRGTQPQQTADERLRLMEERINNPTAKGLQKMTVKFNGKAIDADFNPANGKVTYLGQDITDKAEHYEKPPSPDRVLIQTGSGYMPRAQAAAELGKGGQVPLATTSSTRTMGEAATMIQPKIDEARDMASDLDAAGLFGPVMSRVRQAAAKAGSIDEFRRIVGSDPELQNDRRIGQFASHLGLLASGAARVHYGGRAGASPYAIQGFRDLVSDAGTLDMFNGRLDALDDFIGSYANGPGGAKQTPASGGGDSAYDRYLKRTKK